MDALWGDQAEGLNDPQRGQWFRHDRYSMFIHWGLYSYLGGQWKGRNVYGIGEWIMDSRMAGIPVEEYKALAKEFNPTRFDAKAIVQLAKKAGMRCIVFTAKHHEGFAMYDSRVSDFTITRASPFGRDPMAELAQACREEGIRLGFYYSQNFDWTEPDGGNSRCEMPEGFEPDFGRYFEGKVVPQVTELLTNYGDISVVWFDTPGKMGASYSQRLVDLVHEHQPDCLVNSRVGNGLGDYSTLGDMELPTKTPGKGLFECVDTTNDSWSYSAMDSNWKSPTQIVQNVIRTMSRGCSYMLNIGPDGQGLVPAPAVEALEKAGEWIQVHEEALRGVTASPFPPFHWGECTVKGNRLYVHLFYVPPQKLLRLGALEICVRHATQLSSGQVVPFIQEGGVVTLDLATVKAEAGATVIQLECEETPAAAYQDLCVDGLTPGTLLAEYSEGKGVEVKTARWMEEFGAWKKAEHLQGWEEESTADGTCPEAVWQLDVLEAVPHAVWVEYACDEENEGSEWQVRVGNEQVIFCALSTGQNPEVRRMRYRSVFCGVLSFAAAGRQTLSLSPLQAGTGTISVKRIALEPWR
jgi:alpha-L-fucosidase